MDKRSAGQLYLIVIFIAGLNLIACGLDRSQMKDGNQQWQKKQQQMVEVLRLYGIKDQQILKAMGKVKRHLFIPDAFRKRCNPYGDHPCPIGYNQTISQPYIVAYMSEKLNLKKGEKVLEIGSGSGYQAAILAELGVNVYSIEIIKGLADHARHVLKSQGYEQIHLRHGDGYQGWSEHAPYDAIIGTCAPQTIPEKLVEQLKEGGRMIMPVGSMFQKLIILRKKGGKIYKENDLDVRFVPMVHKKNKHV